MVVTIPWHPCRDLQWVTKRVGPSGKVDWEEQTQNELESGKQIVPPQFSQFQCGQLLWLREQWV